MKLAALLEGIDLLSVHVDLDVDVANIQYDSRQVTVGDVFVAMAGYETDGHRYIPQALAQGAVAVVCETVPEGNQEGEIPYIQVVNSRRALAELGCNYYGHPSKAMTMIGITGTNGKTSTTYLMKAILEQCLDAKVGLIGTNQNLIGDTVLETERTTPESFALQGILAQMRDGGCTHVVMEVSSHAMSLDRVCGIDYAVGVYTNLTQDHLDFHHTMEEYCDAKALLFQQCAMGVYNQDDPWSVRLMTQATCQRFSYGQKKGANLRADHVDLTAKGIAFDVICPAGEVRVQLAIPGEFMVYNTLAAIGAARALGLDLKDIAKALKTFHGVKGRVEVVPTPDKDYTILIDYAHSPDGLINVLSTVQGFAKGRTIAVFGCGGDRDRTKRPKMGAAAVAHCDLAVITSDNPRTEEPSTIIADILPGVEGSTTPYQVVENRIEAIHWAMDEAKAGDVIVLCGKGHETYQEINHVKHHLDEREIVAEYLKQ
ncbi:UDP-N-acetylmuramoyl-L-alanyl-D-glutamate--2,6-diaminopimelate ligase [Bengtsoniella intestinalis]|uniref:UDP-N-acetylmuramoyl-L-alanyl-D-glutamate--2, 6-diaminopimelate ligase n=1 Tax=Bengtsoniella intestinalis TaxID=3073143 RepID=UPI00391EF9AE